MEYYCYTFVTQGKRKCTHKAGKAVASDLIPPALSSTSPPPHSLCRWLLCPRSLHPHQIYLNSPLSSLGPKLAKASTAPCIPSCMPTISHSVRMSITI